LPEFRKIERRALFERKLLRVDWRESWQEELEVCWRVLRSEWRREGEGGGWREEIGGWAEREGRRVRRRRIRAIWSLG